MNRPKISVVIPLYNQGKFLRDCVRSLQAQTYKDWEALVVNDGSTDDSLAIALEFAAEDSRLRVVSKINGGLSSARNHGLELVRGEFIQFLDSDDVLLPAKFERQLAHLAGQPTGTISVSHYRFGSYERIDQTPRAPMPFGLTAQTSLTEFIDGWESWISVPCHCFLFSAEAFTKGGMRFDTRLMNHEDFECWVRLLSRRPNILVLDECLAVYRSHDAGMTRDLGKMRNGFLTAVDLLLANAELPAEAHGHLQRKKREINRVYDRRLGRNDAPFPLKHFPRLRIALGGLRNRFTRRFLGRVHW